MGKRVLIAIVAGLLSIGASGAWADVTLHEEWVTVPEQQRVTGGPEGWKATPQHRVLKGGIAPEDVRPEFITGGGYTPSQISEAYGFSGLKADGTGQTVAIVVACGSPTIDTDLAAFISAFKLPSANLNITYMPGKTCSDPDWGFETSLDVESVHALAPGATIDLVIAPTDKFPDILTAVQYAGQTLNAQVVSMSWSGDEFSGEAYYDRVFQNIGTVFIAATGDSGSGAQYPAASPNVVAAGGTALYLQPGTGTLKFPEVAWEQSGGGVSQFEAKPGYQTAFGIFSSARRCIPDVAFAGDPYTGVLIYDSNYTPPGWWIAGGTSLSAQSWAPTIALADQLRTAAKVAPLTDGHKALYTLAGSSARYNGKGYYRDITWGYNGNYAAMIGYDLITGLGSPMAGTLVPALAVSK